MSQGCDGQAVIYSERVQLARREHVCGACEEAISVGHKYNRSAILYDGHWTNVKRCLRCQELHKHLRGLCEWDSWPAEVLDCGLDYEDEWGEVPMRIARLAFMTPEDAQRELV